MRVLTPRIRRLAAVLLSLGLIVAALASAGPYAGAQSSDLNTDSLALGHAQVVAQGMTAPPDTKSFWRVIKRTIPVRTKAEAADNLMGGAGFLVAGDRAILVIDQKSKARTRLAPGESLFVPASSIQTWASLDDKPASAYSLELVANGTSTDVPAGKIVYADQKPFAIPEGDYVLGLVRDILAKNEKGKLAQGSYSTLVMAMSGSMSIQSDVMGAGPVTLTGGHAAVFSGNLALKATQDGSSYVAALIGPATGVSSVTPEAKTATPKPTTTATPKATKTAEAKKSATPKATATPKKTTKTPTPTATPAPSAQVVIGVSLCPNGVRPEQGVPSLVYCGVGYGGYDLSLVAPDGTIANASEATATYVTWTGLNPGVYQLIVNLIPPGFDSFTLDGYLCCSTPGGFLLTVDEGANVAGTLYLYQPYVAPPPPPPTPTPDTSAPPPTPDTSAPPAAPAPGGNGAQPPAG